jgi:hypothetical protein
MDYISSLVGLKIIPFLKKWNLTTLLLGIIDIAVITLAFQCAYYIKYYAQGGFFFSEPKLIKLYFIIMPFWMLILYLIQINEVPRTKSYSVLFFEYLQSTFLVIILLLVLYFVFKLYLISRF